MESRRGCVPWHKGGTDGGAPGSAVQAFRIRPVPAGAGSHRQVGALRPADHRHPAHRRWKEPLLPAAGHAARGDHGGRLAARRADERPGRRALRARRVLALPATATPEVRKDIARALGLDDPQVFVAGFDRPNLFVEVARASGDAEKVGRILALARQGGAGLVYAATRRNVEKVVLALRANGVDAAGYHAGMDDAERSTAQESFLRGDVSVVVATTAVGMGVDKANIRFVAHFHVPRSI